jgi:hypothetical protein
MFKIDYKIESGASKKRKREAEILEWESKNGPVLVIKKGDKENKK